MTPEQIAERARVLAAEVEILERETDDAYVAGFLGAAFLALDAAHDYLIEPDDCVEHDALDAKDEAENDP